MRPLAILSINTQKAYQPGFAEFLTGILQAGTYDFILMQETTNAVIEIAESANSGYTTISLQDPEAGMRSGASILCKGGIPVETSFLLSFAKIDPNMPVMAWGAVGVIASSGSKKILIVSAHLHPGFKASNRAREVAMIKDKIATYNDIETIILGGDFNTGMPGEITRHTEILGPELVRASRGLGPTLDSRYTEKATWGIARLANFLARFGISLKFRADHFYLDKNTSQKRHSVCRLLKNRVSDHLPLEIVISDHQSEASSA